MSVAIVWFDGACRGNPGPMGAGAVVEVDKERTTLSRAMGYGTNNEAEYHGLLLGLDHALRSGATTLVVRGDSELVIRQLQGRYQVKAANLLPLYREARHLLATARDVRLEWVRREQNAEADAAARDAIA